MLMIRKLLFLFVSVLLPVLSSAYEGNSKDEIFWTYVDNAGNSRLYGGFGSKNGTVYGDVNLDYVVDVADIATVISVMAGSEENSSYADVNGDGMVDVADIAALISIMAGDFKVGYPMETVEWGRIPANHFESIKKLFYNMAMVEPCDSVNRFYISVNGVRNTLWTALAGNNGMEIHAFIDLLNQQTGKKFRIPTANELRRAHDRHVIDTIADVIDKESMGFRLALDTIAKASPKMMVVTRADGTQMKCLLDGTQQMKVEKPYLRIEAGGTQVSFVLDALQQIRYEDAPVDQSAIEGEGVGLLKGDGSRSTVAEDDQQEQYALYNYRNDGDFNAWLHVDIDSITYSKYGIDGAEYDNVVVQEVWTPDSLYRIPIEVIDSIGFTTPETKYKEEVFHLTEAHMPYVLSADSLSITFSDDIPYEMLPMERQIVISDVYDPPFEDGFAGRFIRKEVMTDSLKLIFEDIEMTDIFEQLVLVGKAVSDADDEENAARRKLLGLWGDDYEKSGVHTFELGKLEFSNPDIPVSFEYKPVIKLDYLVYIVKNHPSHYRFVTIGDHTFTAKVNIAKKEFINFDKLILPKWLQFKLPRIAGLIKPKLSLGLFFKADGKVTLDGEWPITLTWKMGYEKIGENDATIINDFGMSGLPQLKFSLEGSASFGVVGQIEAKVLHKKFASVETTVYIGPKVEANFELESSDLGNILNTEPTAYNALRNVDITTSLFLGVDFKYTVLKRTFKIIPGEKGWKSVALGKKEKDESKTSFEVNFWERKYKLVPEFFTPLIRRYDVSSGTADVNLTIKDTTNERYIPKNEEDYIDYMDKVKKYGGLFLPVKIGVKIFDLYDRFICEQEAPDWFYSKTYGSTLQFKNLSGITALPYPNAYVIKPHVSLLGLGVIAEPEKTFFSTNLFVSNNGDVEVGEGEEVVFNVWGCSGVYDAVSSNNAKVEAKMDGGLLHITGKSLGDAVVTVTDKETLEKKEVAVAVVEKKEDTICPDGNHPHLTDLGLPSGTKWACCNVGASKPEEYGSYYAWGETSEKNAYDWTTYSHCDGSYSTCHDIGSNIAGTQYDVAHMDEKWGGSWHMPTQAQIDELLKNCTFEWTTLNGVNGALFTSLINGGTIFIPAAGIFGATRYNTGALGYVWSSTLFTDNDYCAYGLSLRNGKYGFDENSRSGGRNVRPVSE